jgi:hypothetical protein
LPGYTGNKTPGIRKGTSSNSSTIPRLEDQIMASKGLEDGEDDEDLDDEDAQNEYGGLIKYILDLSLG